MRDLVFTLVFSVVLLFFAIYPAIKIVDFFNKNGKLSSFQYNLFTILLTISISLAGGLFLRFF